jgi:DNA-binding GntR family transcriptional regulator
MAFSTIDSALTSVKGNVAGILREQILSGKLSPGEQIVEGRWAAKLKVAQASIREALNMLATEGFVQKELGRSARVTALSEDDVTQIYDVRKSLEGLAAGLVATKLPDLSELDQALADMHSAIQYGNVRSYWERDLQFHLLICEKSGNRFLLEHVRRLIVPLFSFIVLRQHAARSDPKRWGKSYEEHRQILKAIRTGDPNTAERQVWKSIQNFSEETASFLAVADANSSL